MSELLTPGDGSDSLKGRRVGAPERRDDVDFELICGALKWSKRQPPPCGRIWSELPGGQEILVPRTLALSRSTDSRRLELSERGFTETSDSPTDEVLNARLGKVKLCMCAYVSDPCVRKANTAGMAC